MKQTKILTTVVLLLVSLLALSACGGNDTGGSGIDSNTNGNSSANTNDGSPGWSSGGNGSNNSSSGNSNTGSTSNAQVSESLLVDGIEFSFEELDLKPMFSPGGMPAGDSPFAIRLTYSGSGNAKESLATLKATAVLNVNGKQVDIPTTTIGDGFVYLICSAPDDLQAADLSIELIYGGQKLVIK